MGDHMEEIHGFNSPNDFHAFRRSIETMLVEGTLTEVEVEYPYGDSDLFEEHWYESVDGVKWRLVAPEPPFGGVFEPVL